jgi:hypothetical protein
LNPDLVASASASNGSEANFGPSEAIQDCQFTGKAGIGRKISGRNIGSRHFGTTLGPSGQV